MMGLWSIVDSPQIRIVTAEPIRDFPVASPDHRRRKTKHHNPYRSSFIVHPLRPMQKFGRIDQRPKNIFERLSPTILLLNVQQAGRPF